MNQGNAKKNKNGMSLTALFAKNTFVFGFSLVIALVCWIAVAFSSDTIIEYVIEDVEITLAGGSYETYGLEILNQNLQKVDVRVKCSRTVARQLGQNSVVVTPYITGVTSEGPKEVRLNITAADTRLQFDILGCNPSSITLNFGNKQSRKFSVDTSAVTARAADGYLIDKITTYPSEIVISGSQEELDRIDRVVVQHDFAQELSHNQTISDVEVLVFDEFGVEMSKDTLEMSAQRVSLTVPVYKLARLGIGIDFTNVPDGFDVGTLKYTLSVDELEVAGQQSLLETITQPWTVGYVDLSTFEIGKEYSFMVELPQGMINRGSNIVTVSFPQEQISTKRINVTDIRMENQPASFKIEILTSVIRDVNIIGRTQDVESLLPGSVIAIIDFDQISTLETGQRSVTVKFRITSNNTTWVAGSYTVYIDVQML